MKLPTDEAVGGLLVVRGSKEKRIKLQGGEGGRQGGAARGKRGGVKKAGSRSPRKKKRISLVKMLCYQVDSTGKGGGRDKEKKTRRGEKRRDLGQIKRVDHSDQHF